jgi:hypothetical protein
MTARDNREPYEPLICAEAGMAQLHVKEMADRLAHENALKMAGKLGEYAREREARLIQTFWRLIAALVAIIFLLAVFA